MDVGDMPLFSTGAPGKIGVGFHNIGSGVLRASDSGTIKKLEAQYGQRCGHIPLNNEKTYILVQAHSVDVHTHIAYLSQIFGREIKAITAEELRNEQEALEQKALVVPYVNVPESETYIQDELEAKSWGLPGKMTHVLKNKADFYHLTDELALDDFRTPDYTVAHIQDLSQEAQRFLGKTEELLKETGMSHYPLGVMMRASESDGNYGCALAHERGKHVVVVKDGDAEHSEEYASWGEALQVSQEHLTSTMNVERESRVVISRFLDIADSPGLSLVLLDGKVESLRWNGQLQKKGSKACVGTSSYVPQNNHLRRMQEEYEDQTAAFFETLLRKTAQRLDVDFASIRGLANIDIILPGALEIELQRRRKHKAVQYIAECNPRWTNYTDAIMTLIGVSGRKQTINTMRDVIREGVYTIDKYQLPDHVDPRQVRARIFQRDEELRYYGTRIICRMAKNPLGLIFAGNIQRAQQEIDDIVRELAKRPASTNV